MSPAAETQKSSKPNKLDGKEFEETFKPKGKEALAEKDIEGKNNKKGKKAKKEKKEKKDKKKISGFSKIIIILMAFIVVVGGAGAALYFSGNLNSVFEAVGLKKTAEAQSLDQQKAALDQRESTLNAMQQNLDDQQAKLEAQQKAFDDAQAAASASAAASKTFEEIRAGFSEEKLAELKQLGSIYSKMDAAAAAAIMTKMYDEQQIAVIIYYMQPAAAALLMAKLDAQLAASVTLILAT